MDEDRRLVRFLVFSILLPYQGDSDTTSHHGENSEGKYNGKCSLQRMVLDLPYQGKRQDENCPHQSSAYLHKQACQVWTNSRNRSPTILVEKYPKYDVFILSHGQVPSNLDSMGQQVKICVRIHPKPATQMKTRQATAQG